MSDSEFPEPWKPSPGDSISGRVTDVAVIDPNGQGKYPCVTVETADGSRRAIHAFHSVLRNGLARCAPKIGDEIAILYTGKQQGANREYHNYRVSGGQAREVDWDAFLPPDERPDTGAPPIPPAPVRPQQPSGSAGAQFGDDVPF